MSKNHRRFILDEFHNIHNLQEIDTVKTKYLVGKLDDNNITKWMKHKKIKTVIYDFYKKEYKYFVSLGVDKLLSDVSTADEGYRYIMFQLYKELVFKEEYESLSESEIILFLILSKDSSKQHEYTYSDQLVSEFKNVLKEVAIRNEKDFIESTNTELNNVVHHLKNGDYGQAEHLARKIAFTVLEKYKDDFWLNAVLTVIKTLILALAEDVVSAKRENIDMFDVANILENKQCTLDNFIDSRTDNSLAKKTYKPIFLMAFETRNRVIGEAIFSIKKRL